MPFPSRTHPHRRADAKGFALLITITLLAFLVLLLVSLASLTRVETQVASNALQLQQARQNALFGLQIAIGELQKHAGPDQRVTAAATTVYPKKNVTNASGELFDFYRARAQTAQTGTFLTRSERALWENDLRTWWNTGNRNPYWTGVFNSSLRRDSATLGKYGEFKRDQLPVWLVSGNERFSFNPATATSYPSGYFTPDVDVATLAAPADVVELVSADSAPDDDDHIAPHRNDAVDGLSGTVRVVRQPLSATPPGAANQQTIGHYAYWVADESTKANFSVRDPWFEETNRSSVNYRNRLQVPQRVGWERMEGFATSGSSTPLNDPRFEKALAHQQLPLIDSAFTDPVKRNFHHLTTYSRSLHTDTALGGLKKDLTVFLDGSGAGISPAAPIFNASLYASNDPRFGANNTGFPKGSTTNLPTWTQLKNWSDTVAINESDAVPVIPGRAPVVANFNVFYGFSRDGDKLRMHWMPCIVLWNPYDTKLATTDYRLRWRHNIGLRHFGVATRGLVDPNPADHNDGRLVPVDNAWFIHRLDGLDWYNSGSSNYKGAFSSSDYEFGTRPWYESTQGGSGTPNYRIQPFDRGTAKPAPWDPRATWVTYEFTGEFEPGQVKVFTVGADQPKTASLLHDGSETVLLENTFEPNFPASYWFDMATIGAPVPAETDETRMFAIEFSGSTPSSQSVELSTAGSSGATLWRHDVLTNNPGAISISGNFRVVPEPFPSPSNWRIVPPASQWDTYDKALAYNNPNNPTANLYHVRLEPFAFFSFGNANYIDPRASTLSQRAFATFNLAASSLDLSTKIEQSRAGFASQNDDGYPTNKLFSALRIDGEAATFRNAPWNPGHVDNTTNEGYALLTFRGSDTSTGNVGLSRLPMRQVRRANANILSLGQFQQANLSAFAWQPSFPLGNSEATPYVDRARVAGIESYSVGTSGGNFLLVDPVAYPGIHRTSSGPLPNAATNEMLDISYLLNEGLWDSYFLSSIPQTGGVPLDNSDPLPNSRHRFVGAAGALTPTDVRDFDTAAAWLENLGSLNVNSTSVEAWKSLFTAFRGLSYTADNRTGADVTHAIPISRTLDPLPTSAGGGNLKFTFAGMDAAAIGASPTGARNYEKFFLGFRHLTDDMIQALAERIVDEVRLRGPFYSLADFVNRRLVSPDRSGSDPWRTARTANQYPGNPNTNQAHVFGLNDGYNALAGLAGINGALQRAINVSGINGGVNYPISPVNNHDRSFRIETDRSKLISGGMSPTANRPMQMFPSTGHMLDAEHLAGAPVGEAGSLLSHSPGFVTQADLLAMIGPALTARGDTFVIRTYGDTINPATGELTARAWVEAVVQRTVEPVEPAGSSGDARFETSGDFGRRFTIVSMRWLGPEDI